MRIWEYENMRIWEYENMRIWEYKNKLIILDNVSSHSHRNEKIKNLINKHNGGGTYYYFLSINNINLFLSSFYLNFSLKECVGVLTF